MTPRYCYSTNQENYFGDFDSREEAAEEGNPGMMVYVGEIEWPEASDFACADMVINDMRDRAYDGYGEHAEDYLGNVTDEQRAELETLIAEWADRVCPATFFRTKEGSITEHVVPTATPQAAEGEGNG